LGDKVPHRCKGTFRKRKLQFMDRVSGQLDAPVKHDFCDNTYRRTNITDMQFTRLRHCKNFRNMGNIIK
ncbi:MAG: hypothetical protein ABIG69_11480, partial [Bacteroidota bacterium]